MKASKRATKTEATRQRITEAARKVFTEYPYDAASIRTIGQAGGFNHSFIRYHYKSKAKLFEAVSKELIGQYYAAAGELIRGLDGPLIRNTEVLADRFVNFAFENPDAFYVMMLNMGAVDNVKDAFPGMRSLRRFHVETLELFSASNYFTAPQDEVNRVFFCSSIILANCVGAAQFFGKILAMDPSGPEYRQWVKGLFVFLLYPAVKSLVFSEKGAGKGASPHAPAPASKMADLGKAARKTLVVAARSMLVKGVQNPALKRLLTDIEKSALKIRKGRTVARERDGETKGEATRRRIIAVARKVFSKYPYNAASIRMIGEEGGFDFTLLYHYFPKKAELFEAVITQLLDEYMMAVTAIIKDLDSTSLRENTWRFIDSMMDYCFSNPDVMMGSMQNIAQMDKFDDLPGFDVLTRFLVDSLALFREFMPLPPGDERARMWLYGMGMVVFNCVGASSYHARVLGMEPGSHQYRQWVKDTLMFIFYPSMKGLIFSGRSK